MRCFPSERVRGTREQKANIDEEPTDQSVQTLDSYAPAAIA